MASKLKQDKLKLVNLVSASLFAEPRFNQASDEKAQWIRTMVYAVAEMDPEFILKLALYVRDDLNVRSTANYMLALAANVPACAPYLKKYYHKAVRLPSDWLDVAALYQMLPDRSLSGRALPKCLRTAMMKKFQQFDAYQLGKYNKENSMKRKRRKAKLLAEKCREEGKPEPRIPERQLTIKQMIRQLHISQPVPHVMCIIGKKYPSDLIGFRDCGLAGNFDPDRAGSRMKLPVPETWETVISAKGNKAEAWEELIDNRKLPFMAMLRNLRNLLLTGISHRHHRWVMSRLCDENTVANSRQFPFSFFTAYEALEIDLDQLAIDVAEARKEKKEKREGKAPKPAEKKVGEDGKRKQKVIIPKTMPTKELIQKYKAALDTAVKIATVHNVKPIRGSTVVFCSASKSMREGAISARNVGRAKTNVEVGALLGLMCKYMCEECDFRLVSSAKKSGEPDSISIPLKDGTILDNMATVQAMVGRLGEDFTFPFEYIEELIRERKKIDNFIILSDQTIAPGYTELVGHGAAAEGISGILRKYRQEINPDLLYVSVNLAGRKSIVTDTIDESKKHPNDVLISGFSDAILRFVAERGDGNQLDYIQSIDVVKDLDRLTAKLDNRFNRRKIESQTSTFWSFMDKVQTCKHEGCGQKVKQELIDKHIEQCDFRLVPCPEEGCEESVPANQLELHRMACLFRDMAKGDAKKWRTVRVFVSSTFRDMHGERDVLSRFVFPEIKEFCKKRHIHFFDVDLRWGVTEAHTLETGSAIDTCLNEVDRCRPFFIGLLGSRYGWAPEKYLVSEDPRFAWVKEYPAGRSITELEMEYGALAAGGQQLGSLFFLRNDSFVSKVPSSSKPDFEAPEEDKEKLAALREKVLATGRATTYSASWGGIVDDKPMASGLEDFKAAALRRLKEDIVALFPEDGATALSPLAYETQVHEEYLEVRSRRFVGRKEQLKEMFTFADEYKTAGRSGPLVLHGSPGMGKTSTLAKFCRDYREERPGAFVLSHFVGSAPGSTDIRHTLHRICSILVEEYELEDEVDLPQTYDELKLLFPRILELCAFGRPLVICLDSLNALSDNHRAHSLEWLPHAQHLAVPVIVSTYTDSKSFEAVKPRLPTPPMVVLLGMPEEERKQLVRVTLFEYRKVLEEKASNNQMRTLMRKSGSCKPLWLTIACEELRMFGVYELLAAKLKSLPAKVPALLDTVLARIEGDHSTTTVASALSLISCSRNGLSETELLQLLAPPGKQQLPRGNWAAIQRSLETLLRFVGVGEEATLDFAHEEMSAAVKKRYLRTQLKFKETHSRLATFFMERADPSADGSFMECTDQRAIRELPFHLLQAGRLTELEEVLCEVDFVRCKCSFGMVHELLEDVSALRGQKKPDSSVISFSSSEKEDSKVEDLYSFLTASSHVLSVEPRLCLQEAANQPDSSFLARVVKEQGHGMVGQKWLEWFNKPQVHDPCQFTLSGFSEAMMACAFSPDGRSMVVASRDRTMTTYDTATGTELASFLGHTHWVVACSYSPTGSQIVSASWDNSLRIWDADLGTELTLLGGRFGHKKRVASCAYSTDGSLVISGAWDCSVKLWDVSTGECLKTLKGHIKPVNAVAFSEDAERAASASWDCSIKIWDVYSGKCTATLTGHSQSIRSVTFAPNNRHLISTAADCSIRIWDIEKQRAVQTIKGHTSPVNSCSLSSDGKHLISASDDQTVKVWDALGGSEIRSMALPAGDYSTTVAMSGNGKTLVSGSSDCTVHVWDARSGTLAGTLKGHTRVVTTVDISHDGHWAASAAEDKEVRVWDLASMDCLAVLSGHDGAVHGVAFHPTNRNTLVTASEDFTARVWKIAGSGEATVENVLSGHGAAVLSCAFSPNGSSIVSSSRDGSVRIWSAATGKCQKTLLGHKDWITACAFSPDSQKLATVSWDFNVKIWDATSFEELHTLTGHGGGVTDCSWAPSSKVLVTSSFDGTLRLWDVVDGVPVNTMEGHQSRVNGCAWLEKGTKIASASDDGTVKLWDSVAGTEIATLQGHSGTVQSVDFSHDKSQIVSASTDRTVKVWKASVSRVEGGAMSFGPPSSHKEAVTAVSFSADGQTAITASRDAEVLRWDVENARIDSIFDGARDSAVTAAALAPDEAFCCSGTKEGWLALHDASSGTVSCQKMVAGGSVVSAMAYAPAGGQVTTGSWGHDVQIWKVSRQGKLALQCTGRHDDWVNDAAYSTCSSFVMTASHDRTVRLWKTTQTAQKVKAVLRFGGHTNWVLGCDFVPNSTHRCASVSYDGAIKLWDAALNEEVRHIDGHSDRVNACRFLTENLLVTASHDRTARVWDVRVNGSKRRADVAMFHCKAPVSALAVSPANSRIALGDTLGNVYLHQLHR